MACEVHCGDMLELLPRWAAEGFACDTIVTDPPYHLASITKRFGNTTSETKGSVADRMRKRSDGAARLARGFMGSKADSGDISFRPETWKACLDVLVPGGRALVFGGTRTWWKTAAAMDAAGFEIEDTIMWVYGQGLVLRRSRMKPCWEPILVARKSGPVRDLNIEECRVPRNGGRYRENEPSQETRYADKGGTNFAALPGPRGGDPKGGWPGNLITDGSDEVLSCFPNAPGQIAKAAEGDGRRKTRHVYGGLARKPDGAEPRDDSGSAARFFVECGWGEGESRLIYEGKAPGNERVFHCAKCGQHAFRRDRDAHRHDAAEGDWEHLREHATVKPQKLLEHLVRLACPPGGLVLDPFAGTGGIGPAAMRAGRDAVLIEKDAVHAKTCRFRLAAMK